VVLADSLLERAKRHRKKKAQSKDDRRLCLLNLAPSTVLTLFVATIEMNRKSGLRHFQSITLHPQYQRFSFEESRLADHNGGRRFGS